jgi:hypothetical protein
MNVLGELGGTHIFMFNLTKQKVDKNVSYVELGCNEGGDIVLNP